MMCVLLVCFVSRDSLPIFFRFLEYSANLCELQCAAITLVSFILIGLLIGDLGFLSTDFLHLKKNNVIERQFKPDDVIKFLLNDKDFFRINPVDDFSTNKFGYFSISSIGGYRPVKLRTYQDLMDSNGLNKFPILNMLNVKYLVSKKQINHPYFQLKFSGTKNVYLNKGVLPRAWLINKIKYVSDQVTSLEMVLKNEFNPSQEAIIINKSNGITTFFLDNKIGDNYILKKLYRNKENIKFILVPHEINENKINSLRNSISNPSILYSEISEKN